MTRESCGTGGLIRLFDCHITANLNQLHPARLCRQETAGVNGADAKAGPDTGERASGPDKYEISRRGTEPTRWSRRSLRVSPVDLPGVSRDLALESREVRPAPPRVCLALQASRMPRTRRQRAHTRVVTFASASSPWIGGTVSVSLANGTPSVAQRKYVAVSYLTFSLVPKGSRQGDNCLVEEPAG